MLLVTVICSDPECTEEREIAVEELDAIDATVCECGHGFVVVAVSELGRAVESATVIELPKRRRAQSRRAA
jgi:hypothetical protein